ncbi:tetratricopeptide repeat protein [Hyalangium gracile]|uniref:tetratricopeptide repeat protein n=1 Tax=Hyalangium gracile TaxID=394092 RepID=UPI001CCC9400|nr:tetratricopeptide repeat protein [Hyalangium gracile]
MRERDRRLSESTLWALQRRYFEREGVDAWRTMEVPHYVTCNPALAHSVALIVCGYLRDCLAAESRPGSEQPFHILELGAGSGRFGYLFLKAWLEQREAWGLAHVPVRYVLTDFTESNLSFWRNHPSLAPFVAQGLLDFALFDLERSATLELREAGRVLGPGSLERPLLVLANYVLDSVPQDAFHFQGGQVHACLATLTTESPEVDLGSEDALSHLRLELGRSPVADPTPYAEPEFNELLGDYARLVEDRTLLFPVVALRGMRRLAALSGGRLLLIAGDKGYVRDEELQGQQSPHMAVHGSFSLPVNFNALRRWFQRQGGEVLEPAHRQLSLPLVACMLGAPAAGTRESRLGFHLAFGGGGSDDFFRLRQGIQDHYGGLEFDQLLSLLRMSRHDCRILRDCMPVLSAQAEALTDVQRQELRDAVRRTWDNYFHIGEERDLAFEFALLLHLAGEVEQALALYQESLRLYGEDPRTRWNMALCLFRLHRQEEAAGCLARAWEVAPDFAPTRGLLIKGD